MTEIRAKTIIISVAVSFLAACGGATKSQVSNAHNMPAGKSTDTNTTVTTTSSTQASTKTQPATQPLPAPPPSESWTCKAATGDGSTDLSLNDASPVNFTFSDLTSQKIKELVDPAVNNRTIEASPDTLNSAPTLRLDTLTNSGGKKGYISAADATIEGLSQLKIYVKKPGQSFVGQCDLLNPPTTNILKADLSLQCTGTIGKDKDHISASLSASNAFTLNVADLKTDTPKTVLTDSTTGYAVKALKAENGIVLVLVGTGTNKKYAATSASGNIKHIWLWFRGSTVIANVGCSL